MKNHLFVAISLSVVLASHRSIMIMMMIPAVSRGAEELYRVPGLNNYHSSQVMIQGGH